MLVLRLTRVGKKKQPSYRLIVQEKKRDPWGKALEIIGRYNPRTNPKTVDFDAERVKFWLSKGAVASDTVHNLLINAKIIKSAKRKNAVDPKRKDAAAEPEKKAEEKK
ncbi:MAG: 30S ribosomal protein S16 [Patescibacteria group bacterium]|jgi:small subunit ribosomal protein S16